MTELGNEVAHVRGGLVRRRQRDDGQRTATFHLHKLRHSLKILENQVVTFMRQLSDNQATVESFLLVLGAGNWGGPPARSPNPGQEEDSLITRYLSQPYPPFRAQPS